MGKIIISKIFAETNRPVDPDAFAFITIAGITDYGQKQAINKLVNDLKANSLWNKFDCLYPMVGGDATKHRFNLKNPLRYNLTFFGGWAHSATGALPNGTNGYADTGFNDLLTQLNSIHLSYYSRTQNVNSCCEMGYNSSGGGTASQLRLNVSYSGAMTIQMQCVDTNNTANAVSKGFFVGSRHSSVLSKGYLNGVVIHTSAFDSALLRNYPVFIGASNTGAEPGGTGFLYSNRECAFSSIGKGLSDAEATAYNTIVTAFQTLLNRQNP